MSEGENKMGGGQNFFVYNMYMYGNTHWAIPSEPLDGFWRNLVGMKYSRSTTSVIVFQQDLLKGGSRAIQARLQRGPWMHSNDLKASWKEAFGSSPKCNFKKGLL